MSTSYRIINPHALYFLTMTVVDWVDLFTRDQNRKIIIESLDYCRKKKGLRIWAYVIMTNHMHLIVSSENNNLSGIIRDFKRHSARRLIRSVQNTSESRRDWILDRFSFAGKKSRDPGIEFQVWVHDNHAVELESYKFIMQKLAYIHNNPVSAGFIDDPNAWVYSSQRNYMGEPSVLEIDLLEY